MTPASALGAPTFLVLRRVPSVRIARLRAALLRSERAWRDGDTGSAESRAIWEGLIGGDWSLFDRFDANGRSILIARWNDGGGRERALSPRERSVAESLGLGLSEKEIAYVLQLSTPVVSRCTSAARAKLRLTTRAELAGLFAPTGVCRRMVEVSLDSERFAVGSTRLAHAHTLAPLSPSERVVAHAACLGSSSAAIAAERGTSRRTIENQLGAVYRKLGVHSLTELAAKVSA